jgi:hypothetical protein
VTAAWRVRASSWAKPTLAVRAANGDLVDALVGHLGGAQADLDGDAREQQLELRVDRARVAQHAGHDRCPRLGGGLDARQCGLYTGQRGLRDGNQRLGAVDRRAHLAAAKQRERGNCETTSGQGARRSLTTFVHASDNRARELPRT